MGSNGFCGFSLQKNIIVLAIIDLICEIVVTAFGVVLLVRVVKQFNKVNQPNDDRNVDESKRVLFIEVVIAITSLTIHIVLYLLQICLSILLLIAAIRKSFRKCRIWLNITTALLIISVVSMIINYIFGHDEGKPTSSIAPQLFLYLYKAYMLWVVYSYMSTLRYNNHTRENGPQDFDECQE